MRQKRIKSYRKVMQSYHANFQFREPYQLLVDAAFLRSCVVQKLDFTARLQDVTQGIIKPMITQCSMQVLYDAGVEGQAAVDLAKDFERRKCNHFKVRPEEECLTTMAGNENKNRYIIATQSLELRKVLRLIPGVPLIYINRSVVLLETPSDATVLKKNQMERVKLHVPASELALLSKSIPSNTNDSNLITGSLPLASTSSLPLLPSTPLNSSIPIATTTTDDEPQQKKKKKVKGPKGPNPLSMKKASTTTSSTTSPSKSTSANASIITNRRLPKKVLTRKEMGVQAAIERDATATAEGSATGGGAGAGGGKKRKREDGEEGKVESLARRGTKRPIAIADPTTTKVGGEEEEAKKKKRSRGGNSAKRAAAAAAIAVALTAIAAHLNPTTKRTGPAEE